MEVKVFCPCGSKYKFDVEPVNERMPWAVNCPSCGADGTALANEIIAKTLAANPPPPAAMPAPAPVPIATMAAPAVPAPAPAAGGLRINKPAAAPPPPIAGAPPNPSAPPRFTPGAPRPLAGPGPKPSSEPMWKKVGGGIVGVLVVGLVAFRWIYRIWRLSHAISAGSSAMHDPQIAAAVDEAKEMNLIADNAVVLYVKNDDYRAVAQDCAAFWKEKQHINYQLLSADRQSGNGMEYVVYPAHHGYVRIMGGLDWKDPMFEATAKHLSEKYNSIVFDEKDVSFSSEFVFGVYDQGSNVFHARMTIVRDDQEKTTVENVEWAKAHGYIPGKHGSKDFDLIDANRITKTMGMKFWDEPAGIDTNFLVLAAHK
jgi:hypothetical protein